MTLHMRIGLASGIVLLVAELGCDKQPPPTTGGQVLLLSQVEKDWTREVDGLDPHLMSTANRKNCAMSEIIARLKPAEFQMLSGQLASQTKGKRTLSEFQLILSGELVYRCVNEGDRAALVHFLSQVPVNGLGPHPMEFVLTYYGRETLVDPILIIMDAYEQATSSKVRDALAGALEMAFAGLVQKGATQGDFVAECRRWYEKNRNEYVVDEDYASGDFSRWQEGSPLFKPKSR